MDSSSLSALKDYLSEKLKNKIQSITIEYGELNVFVFREEILSTLFFLRDDPKCLFIGFIDASGVDYPDRVLRFGISYHLLSPRFNLRIRVKTETDEETPISSAFSVYPGIEWYEREIYDLFGVVFIGHPDLRRILTDYGFEGHPLRKDFPTSGFVECRYDGALKRVIYEPVVLTQEMRSFDFLSPWGGEDFSKEQEEKQEKSDV